MSNHLVLRGPPGPFKYLEDIVEIRSVSGIAYLDSAKRNNLHVTYYDLLNRLERHPHHIVSYVRKGELYRHQSAETLREDIIEILHPRWFRKWFHFRPVDIAQPTVCGRNG